MDYIPLCNLADFFLINEDGISQCKDDPVPCHWMLQHSQRHRETVAVFSDKNHKNKGIRKQYVQQSIDLMKMNK